MLTPMIFKRNLSTFLAEDERKTLQNIFDHFDAVDNEILKKITNENLKSMSDEDLLYWAQVLLKKE